jgi:hypothetical protein
VYNITAGFTEGAAAASALASASRQLCELLEVLVELAALCPGFFRPRLEVITVKFVTAIIINYH